jgi:hypothetical protein
MKARRVAFIVVLPLLRHAGFFPGFRAVVLVASQSVSERFVMAVGSDADMMSD